ncbi:MAG TPA: DUF4230 domain-containing protein [Herpetosiphonaceae bacterium]
MYYDDDTPSGAGCFSGAAILALGLVILGAFFYFGLNRATSNLNPFGGASINNPLAAAPTTISVDRPAVIQQIRALNRLETTTASIEKVITAEQGGSAFYNFFRGDKLLLVAHGDVIAGFDLSKMRPEDVVVSEDGKSATVALPPPEILVSRLDNEKTYVYDRETGIFNQGNPGLESEARRVAEQQILQAACEDNILKRAADEGKRSIENLVKAFGIDTVVVTVPEGQCTLPSGGA